MKKSGKYIQRLLYLLMIPAILAGCGQSEQSSGGREASVAATGERQQPSAGTPAVPGQTAQPAAGVEKAETAPAGVSEIFIQKNTNGTGDGFSKLLSLMEGKGTFFYKKENAGKGFIGNKDVVLIKINSQWAKRGGTNTDLLKSIIEAIVRHPDIFGGEIIVADNGQAQYGSTGKGGSLDWDNANSLDKKQSVLDVVNYFKGQGVRISGVLWDKFTKKQVQEFESGGIDDGFVLEDKVYATGIRISYPKFTTEYGTKVSFKKGIWKDDLKAYDSSSLKILNVPVLKAHGIYQVTGAVKSYMGANSYALTGGATHYNIGKGAMGTQMAYTRMPVLHILDAIWIMPSGGPGAPYSRAVETDMVLAATDPVALDYWASKNILMVEAQKAGNRRYESMSPDGKTPGTFGYWLDLSMKELHGAGFQATMDESKIEVYTGE